MVFKYGPGNLIQSLSINPLTELVETTLELKIQNFQIIAIDTNGSNSLCFCKSVVFF